MGYYSYEKTLFNMKFSAVLFGTALSLVRQEEATFSADGDVLTTKSAAQANVELAKSLIQEKEEELEVLREIANGEHPLGHKYGEKCRGRHGLSRVWNLFANCEHDGLTCCWDNEDRHTCKYAGGLTNIEFGQCCDPGPEGQGVCSDFKDEAGCNNAHDCNWFSSLTNDYKGTCMVAVCGSNYPGVKLATKAQKDYLAKHSSCDCEKDCPK